jgi:uncharacterized RDD family membrane protein YckC
MVSSTGASVQPPGEARYGRFNLRLRAFAIDFIIFLLAMLAGLSAVTATNSENLARVIGFSIAAAYFLYEPLLVSSTGSTIGHYLSNLRVVDDRGGNVGFLKALARALIKIALSWYSFLTMLVTRRHQAVHDWLTRSTVQVRDPTKAVSAHYVGERLELSSPSMPSRLRRIVVILIYLMLLAVVLTVGLQLLTARGVLPAVSPSCINYDHCSASERFQMGAFGLCLIVAAVLCIGLGWRGRLWGARRDRGAVEGR